jgi:hypothetical protein
MADARHRDVDAACPRNQQQQQSSSTKYNTKATSTHAQTPPQPHSVPSAVARAAAETHVLSCNQLLHTDSCSWLCWSQPATSSCITTAQTGCRAARQGLVTVQARPAGFSGPHPSSWPALPCTHGWCPSTQSQTVQQQQQQQQHGQYRVRCISKEPLMSGCRWHTS